jgi:hypothetical protein
MCTYYYKILIISFCSIARSSVHVLSTWYLWQTHTQRANSFIHISHYSAMPYHHQSEIRRINFLPWLLLLLLMMFSSSLGRMTPMCRALCVWEVLSGETKRAKSNLTRDKGKSCAAHSLASHPVRERLNKYTRTRAYLQLSCICIKKRLNLGAGSPFCHLIVCKSFLLFYASPSCIRARDFFECSVCVCVLCVFVWYNRIRYSQ